LALCELLDLGLSDVQARVAGVTLWTAVWWISECVPLAVSSLLPAVCFPLLGVLPAREASLPYMDDLVLLFLGAFLLALGLERWDVHRRMALAIVARTGTRPRRLVLGFTLASTLCSMWMNNTATALMLLPSGAAVVAATSHLSASDPRELERRAAFASALMLGIAYGASIGGVATPVGTAPNQVFLGQFRTLFPEAPVISFSAWMAALLPLSLVWALVAAWLLTRVALRVDDAPLRAAEVVAHERASQGRWSAPQRAMAGLFATAAVLWITRSDLDLGDVRVRGWGPILARAMGAEAPGGLASDATVALLLSCVAFLWPVAGQSGERARLLDWSVSAKIPWDVLLLIGGGFCLAKGFQHSGLDRALGQTLAPWIEGAPTWLVVLGIVVLMIALSEIASNTAITAVMMPVLAQLAVAGGIDPRLVMLPAAVAASAGFMLPVATPPNAIVFATRLVPMGHMVRAGFLLDLASALLVFAVIWLWARPILGLAEGLPAWALPR
jgi:sodium-dependent dicarboxylate transporter 2/3/5